MNTARNSQCVAIVFRLFALSLLALLSACALGSHDIPRFGIGGRYQQGKDQFLRGRGGNMDKAIAGLESVVTEDPAYKDSLTLLARAYYNRQRYKDAFLILQRALAVNKEDEIAWLVLGLTQLHLGQDESGMESLKGGITLLARSAKTGYRGYEDWDTKGNVRVALRRIVLLAMKGSDEKQDLIQATERLLARIDDEENFQIVDSRIQERRDQGGSDK
jgi:tetratricopeptide (TPR) repeat protein